MRSHHNALTSGRAVASTVTPQGAGTDMRDTSAGLRRFGLAAEHVLDFILSTAEQGIIIHDSSTILLSNARVSELLDYPDALIAPGADMKAFLRYGQRRGDFRGDFHLSFDELIARINGRDPIFAERTLPDGRVVRVDSRFRSGYRITTYTNVTAARLREDELRRSRAKIHQLAVNDGLTGILNRSTFDARLSKILAAHYDGERPPGAPRPALVALDLDGFKAVNDMRGHLVGDCVLRVMAERFAETLGPDDIVARLGGDEFAALTFATAEWHAHRLASRMCAVARQPVRVDDHMVSVGASAGYVLAPDEVTSPSDMLRFADLALYTVKRGGRGKAAPYTPHMLAASRDRVELEAELRQAVEKDQLVLHYQVQHDMHAQMVVGYEALMRWNHPTRGLLPPGAFIPIAEETGVIADLGRWALRRATMDFAGVDDRLRVAVNVSPVQVTQTDLVGDVRDALRHSGLKPSQLEIEVTEEVLLEDTQRTQKVFEELVELGVALSLDDFGSGYSSLAYLTLFPFKKIKIDRSFVMRMNEDERSATLVSSILAMVGALSLKVSAEGVETPEQLNVLAAHGCDEAQGFLLGRPEPLDDLRARGMTRSMVTHASPAARTSPRRVAIGRRAAGYMDVGGSEEGTYPPPAPIPANVRSTEPR